MSNRSKWDIIARDYNVDFGVNTAGLALTSGAYGYSPKIQGITLDNIFGNVDINREEGLIVPNCISDHYGQLFKMTVGVVGEKSQ